MLNKQVMLSRHGVGHAGALLGLRFVFNWTRDVVMQAREAAMARWAERRPAPLSVEPSAPPIVSPPLRTPVHARAKPHPQPAQEAVIPLEGVHGIARLGDHTVMLSDGLHGPVLDLSPDQLQLGLRVFQLSLQYVAEHLPQVPIVLVYLPSELSCYQLVGESVVSERYTHAGRVVVPARMVKERSDHIAAQVFATAAQYGIECFDARPVLRQTASRYMIHGPHDWLHLNRRGQEALAAGIVRFLRERGYEDHL